MIPASKTELAFMIIDRFMPCVEVFGYVMIGAVITLVVFKLGLNEGRNK